MEFKVPLKYQDLTLRQLIVLETETDVLKRVSACANISIDKLRQSPMSEVQKANKHLTEIAQMESGKHMKVIELGGVEYGFIPDWNEFSLGEWIDLENYCEDFWNNALKIASILYRPIDRRQGDKYTIKPYTTKEDVEVFNEMSAEIFGGCLLFFSNTRKKYRNILKSSLIQEMEKQMSSLINGDGILSSTTSQERTSSRWTKLVSYLSGLYSRILPTSKTLNTK